MIKLLFLLLTIFFLPAAVAQTNVSGGIYSNTTWKKANSPFIVTSDVVVFTGVTLTIEPGVTVRFRNKTKLEIRQGKLDASGSVSDPINFTSDSSTPDPGCYAGILLNGGTTASVFDHCIFSYAEYAINTSNINFGFVLPVSNSIIQFTKNGIYCPYVYVKIDRCEFAHNSLGLMGDGNILNSGFHDNTTGFFNPGNTTLVRNCRVYNNDLGLKIFSSAKVVRCTVRNNQVGILMNSGGSLVDTCTINSNQFGLDVNGFHTIRNSVIDSNSVIGLSLFGNKNTGHKVYNCEIKYNLLGLRDSFCKGGLIKNNMIAENQTGIRLKTDMDTFRCNRICNNSKFNLHYVNANNVDVSGNFWCAKDSASARSGIYDGFKNVNYGLVFFMPMDSSCAIIKIPASVSKIHLAGTMRIAPNPFSDHTLVQIDQPCDKINFHLINPYGKCLKQVIVRSEWGFILERQQLSAGIYIIEAFHGDVLLATAKLVITD